MQKNILITGVPKSGKSTLLRKVIVEIPKKVGFVTNEILGENGRVGFEIETSTGQKATLSHVDFQTNIKVGKYFVDTDALKSVLPGVANFDSDDILYLDEVGEMQLHSEKFRALVHQYLDSKNTCLMTVSKVFQSDFIEELKGREDVLFVEVTAETRDERIEFVRLFLTKIQKAKGYVSQPERFSKNGETVTLRSEHGIRTLSRVGSFWACTCDFFAQHHICSHALATKELFV
jgi:nucleoside-triphosphatase THEP1